jgi:dTDP-4-amino-4,6-dideoxygalactose transaminase
MQVLPRGARVAVPNFTFTATLNAVVQAGMTPVIFDCDPLTWQIDQTLLAEHEAEYDGIIVVSPFGYEVDVETYDHRFGKKPIVYDFAGAWGNKISRFHPTTFSLHATKTLPIGEGGLVMFPEKHMKANAEALINFNFNQFKQPMNEFGFNGKMDELHASVLCAQLDRLEELQKTTELSITVVASLLAYRTFIRLPRNIKGNLQLPVVAFAHFSEAEDLIRKYGIETRRYYTPLMSEVFPQFKHVQNFLPSPFTVALPRPLNREEAYEIIDTVLKVIGGR